MSERRKIFFKVERDESGFPPVGAESLWASPTAVSSEYVLDNIPFFERVATLGDRVTVEELDGRLWYCATIENTGHSLIRVVGLDGRDPSSVGKELEALGCSWERDAAHGLISVDVPPQLLERAQALVAEHALSGAIDYEEALLRQPTA